MRTCSKCFRKKKLCEYRQGGVCHQCKRAYSKAYSYVVRANQYGTDTKTTVKELYNFTVFKILEPCHYCGDTKDNGLDHLVPLSKGGTNESSNLVSCCLPCNKSKGMS